MRRVISVVDQLSAGFFVAGAAILIGLVRAAGWIAHLRANAGGIELTRILTAASIIALVVFAVRRRQWGEWAAAAQVLGVLVAANVLGLALMWPWVPKGLPVTLGGVMQASVANGSVSMLLGAPLAAACLYLSRRFGSHSSVTERRAGEVEQHRMSGAARTRHSSPLRRAIEACDAQTTGETLISDHSRIGFAYYLADASAPIERPSDVLRPRRQDETRAD